MANLIGGDFNAKHHYWGSQLITSLGCNLLQSINSYKATKIAPLEPTHWSTNGSKTPDTIDFFIAKNIPTSHCEIQSITDLSFDHSPIILTVHNSCLYVTINPRLTNITTNWDNYRDYLCTNLTMCQKIKSSEELNIAVKYFNSTLVSAAIYSTSYKTKINKALLIQWK